VLRGWTQGALCQAVTAEVEGLVGEVDVPETTTPTLYAARILTPDPLEKVCGTHSKVDKSGGSPGGAPILSTYSEKEERAHTQINPITCSIFSPGNQDFATADARRLLSLTWTQTVS